MSKNIHIRFDWAIKRLLRNKANFDILEGFLSELLKQDIKIQEIIESQSNKTHETDKYNQVDILVKSKNDELMLIEIQNEKEDDYFHRMNYGQAKLITENISQSQKYGVIKKVFSINIVYFGLGQGKDYIYIGNTIFRGMHHHEDILQLSEKQKEIYPVRQVSDIFTTYYIIKVNNFDEVAKDSLDEWIYFLKTSEIKDEFKAKGLSQAKERLRVDNLPKEQRDEYEIFIKQERIRESEIETANTDGYRKAQTELMPIIEEERRQKEEAQKREEEARKREEEAKIQLAKKMLKYGESIEEIRKETGLPIEQILQLQQS